MKMKRFLAISLTGIFLSTGLLWPQTKSPLDESLSIFDTLTSTLKVESLIGKPIRSGDTHVIPFAWISFGLGSGGAMMGYGGGMGGKAIPFGILVIEGEDVRVELFPLEEKKPSLFAELLPVIIKMLPQIMKMRSAAAAKPPEPKAETPEKKEKKENPGEESLDEVIKLFNKEKYREALTMVESLIANDPDCADLYAWKGNVMGSLAQGNPADMMTYGMGAIEAFDKTLELDPEHALGHFGRGIGRLMAPEGFGGDLDGAIEDFEFTCKKEPFPEAYYQLGVAYQRKGLNEKAKEAFKKALEMRPNYPAASKALAEIG
jgi:uncharacterized spore protein YtfJ